MHFRNEQHRLYPHGVLESHVLGFTDMDGNGIAGIENYFDRVLRERGPEGQALQLSLDARVQHVLRDELVAAMETFQAVGAAGLVMDANTGEILALTSLPDFDPNHPTAAPNLSRFNQATKGVYELGSVFKVLTLTAARRKSLAPMMRQNRSVSPVLESGIPMPRSAGCRCQRSWSIPPI